MADYAQMRMAPAEIREALLLDRGIDLPHEDIANALREATSRDLLAPRSVEEQRSARTGSFRSQDERRDFVRDWLEVARILSPARLCDLPQDRSEWMTLVGAFLAAEESGASARAAVQRLATGLPAERAKRPARRDLWSLIGPAASMRMTPREIQCALWLQTDEPVSRQEIARQIQYARRGHRLPVPTPEERRDARINVSFAQESDLCRWVCDQLDAAAVLLFSRDAAWPSTRLAWRERVSTPATGRCADGINPLLVTSLQSP